MKPNFRLHRYRFETVSDRKGENYIATNHKPTKADPTGMYRQKSCPSTGPGSEMLNQSNSERFAKSSQFRVSCSSAV